MNNTIKTMVLRSSIRKYDSRPIEPEQLQCILQATHQSPTYVNGQQYSIIVIDDENKKQKIAQAILSHTGNAMNYIAEAPVFLLFVIDFHKINEAITYEGAEMKITDSIESLLIGTVDVGIAAEAATVAAESLGLGTVIIGAIRSFNDLLIEEFNLPEKTIPLLGLVIGHPHPDLQRQVTPRLALDSLVHHNVYESKDFKGYFERYNVVMKDFFKKNRGFDRTWTENITHYFSEASTSELSKLYQKQGFHF